VTKVESFRKKFNYIRHVVNWNNEFKVRAITSQINSLEKGTYYMSGKNCPVFDAFMWANKKCDHPFANTEQKIAEGSCLVLFQITYNKYKIIKLKHLECFMRILEAMYAVDIKHVHFIYCHYSKERFERFKETIVKTESESKNDNTNMEVDKEEKDPQLLKEKQTGENEIDMHQTKKRKELDYLLTQYSIFCDAKAGFDLPVRRGRATK